MSPRGSTASGKSGTTTTKAPVRKAGGKVAPARPRASRATTEKSRAKASLVTQDERMRLIAEAAYYKAEKRDFTGGDELGDWIEAEAEIDALLSVREAD